jgi:hypothetical protein
MFCRSWNWNLDLGTWAFGVLGSLNLRCFLRSQISRFNTPSAFRLLLLLVTDGALSTTYRCLLISSALEYDIERN